jgi:hypothetical protein
MKNPKYYKPALASTMTFVLFLFTSFGIVLYFVLGKNTPEVLDLFFFEFCFILQR